MLRTTCVPLRIDEKEGSPDGDRTNKAALRLLCRAAIPICDPPDLKSKTAARAGTRHGSKDNKSTLSSYRNASRMARQSGGGGAI